VKNGTLWIRIPIALGAFAYLIWVKWQDPSSVLHQSWSAMRIAGACLIVVGLIFWTVASIQLGSSFSVRAKASNLVTHGIYSRIRNPIYVFGSVLFTGFCLIMEKPLWLLVFVVLIPLQVARARAESKVLEEKFGDEYRNYRRATWF
jgi:protein-S-isoprenylcysteine O-methyltransferase Ste14